MPELMWFLIGVFTTMAAVTRIVSLHRRRLIVVVGWQPGEKIVTPTGGSGTAPPTTPRPGTQIIPPWGGTAVTKPKPSPPPCVNPASHL